ncbi:ubiquitin-like protein ATG12 [Dendrobium catenatum]|uniref:ubiquitin-like protein ATG12 n=1 Tax=Dendrobium catenatum TaxID=906689 RepID=UPI00109F0284|nr:ubiquitin-like protein ATG12 [Dendrobium catenatum]
MASELPASDRKVVVHLRATGDAPILKQAKFKKYYEKHKNAPVGKNKMMLLLAHYLRTAIWIMKNDMNLIVNSSS